MSSVGKKALPLEPLDHYQVMLEAHARAGSPIALKVLKEKTEAERVRAASLGRDPEYVSGWKYWSGVPG